MESKCEIDSNGNKLWRNSDGKYHRENDLPSIEFLNGFRCWHIDGKIHRNNGPAVIYSNGLVQWHLNGIHYSINKPEKMPLCLFLSYCKYNYKDLKCRLKK